jgi:streptomycin 6-kinase
LSLFIPARLRESVAGYGAEESEWLAGLPDRVAELEQAWSLTAEQAFETQSRLSWVAPVRLADGCEAVLKIGIPHREARREADALRAFDGRGAVRLLRASADGFALLMERCVPGNDLWALGEEEANALGAAVLARLWREPEVEAPFEHLADLAAEWCAELPREAPARGYDAALITEAVERARFLAATQPRTVLLHGDFHPANVLAAAREPWLAIDGKPLVGDPAYDLAQWLGNRCRWSQPTPEAVTSLRRQIGQFSERLALEPARVAGWAFVKSLAWDWGPAAARVLHAAIREPFSSGKF